MPHPPIDELLAVAVEAARAGGLEALARFGKPLAVERKPDLSPVTEADRASEAAIRAVIARRYPDHAVLGEEGGESAGLPGLRWIVDPIDGTQTFVRGVPLWGVQVAVEIAGEPLVGVIHLPAVAETIAAGHGLGCERNGSRCRVSETGNLDQALVLVTDWRAAARQTPGGEGWQRLAATSGMVRTWADCYGYALVATGRADICLDPVMAIWDTAPLLVIIEEAGGRFTDWTGKRTHVARSVIASNGRLHEPALGFLK